MLYGYRPLVCRTFGLPLRQGDRYLPKAIARMRGWM